MDPPLCCSCMSNTSKGEGQSNRLGKPFRVTLNLTGSKITMVIWCLTLALLFSFFPLLFLWLPRPLDLMVNQTSKRWQDEFLPSQVIQWLYTCMWPWAFTFYILSIHHILSSAWYRASEHNSVHRKWKDYIGDLPPYGKCAPRFSVLWQRPQLLANISDMQ